jgi:hypothetical protein
VVVRTVSEAGSAKGVVFVGAVLTQCWMRSGTAAGVTLSMNLKAGRSRRVVRTWPSGSECEVCGIGMLEAESIIFYRESQYLEVIQTLGIDSRH